MFRKDGKFCWCWKCVLTAVLALSFIIILLLMIVKIGELKANASELIIPKYDSVIARKRLLELIAEGKLAKPRTQFEIEQNSNQEKFLIKSVENADFINIRLIPEIDGKFSFPSVAAWEFLFDKNYELTEVFYYFRKDREHYLKGKAYLSSMEFSLVINNEVIFEDIAIPMSIRNFILMPFKNFVYETRQSLFLDWIFPDSTHVAINERARNFSDYLEIKISSQLKKKVSTSNQVAAALNEMELQQALSRQIKSEVDYINIGVEHFVKYIESGSLDTDQLFLPYDKQNRPIPYFDSRFIDLYVDKVIKFLKLYPSFYTSLNDVKLPFNLDKREKLSSLYSKLYLSTAKYPGVFYLVSIIQLKNIGEKTIEDKIGMEILVPYFSASGEFKIFGYDGIQHYINAIETNNKESLEYLYTLKVLRVPNKHHKKLEIE